MSQQENFREYLQIHSIRRLVGLALVSMSVPGPQSVACSTGSAYTSSSHKYTPMPAGTSVAGVMASLAVGTGHAKLGNFLAGPHGKSYMCSRAIHQTPAAGWAVARRRGHSREQRRRRQVRPPAGDGPKALTRAHPLYAVGR